MSILVPANVKRDGIEFEKRCNFNLIRQSEILTVSVLDVDNDAGLSGIGRHAGVIPRVTGIDSGNDQFAPLTAVAHRCAARQIVVYHPVLVVPENVRWRIDGPTQHTAQPQRRACFHYLRAAAEYVRSRLCKFVTERNSIIQGRFLFVN